MNRATRIGVGVVAFAGLTWGFGWWAVPALALTWGWRGRAGEIALAALLGWAALLVVQHLRAPLLPLAGRAGGVFGLPAWGLLVLTPLFAALLAWSAAILARALVPPRSTGGT